MQPATCQGGHRIIERHYSRTGQHGGAQVTPPVATDQGAAAKAQLGDLGTCNRQTRSCSQTAGPKRERKNLCALHAKAVFFDSRIVALLLSLSSGQTSLFPVRGWRCCWISGRITGRLLL